MNKRLLNVSDTGLEPDSTSRYGLNGTGTETRSQTGTWDWDMGLVLSTGTCDWTSHLYFIDRLAIGTWDWDLGLGRITVTFSKIKLHSRLQVVLLHRHT